MQVEVKTNSMILYDNLQSTKQVEEKSTHNSIVWIKEQVENNTIEKVTWIPNKEMIAEIFTKADIKTNLMLSVISDGILY